MNTSVPQPPVPERSPALQLVQQVKAFYQQFAADNLERLDDLLRKRRAARLDGSDHHPHH